MRCVFLFQSVVGLLSPFAAYAELQRSNQKATTTVTRDIPLDDSEGDLPPLAANPAPQHQRWSLQSAVKRAEQDPVEDPEANNVFPDEMTQTEDSSEVQLQVTQHPVQPPAGVFPHIRSHPTLIASKRGTISQSSDATAAGRHPAVVEEFDVVDNGIPVGIPTSQGRVIDGEQETVEDKSREQIGDYDKVVPQGAQAKARSHIPQSLVHTRSTSAQGSRAHDSAARKTRQKPGPEKMKAQCMAFADYLKAQDVQGPELIRMWKGSCDPIVASGKAGPSMSTMCSAMGGALEPYVMKQNWPAGEVCDEVLRLFNEAGIGA
jgi:hypothetical protein